MTTINILVAVNVSQAAASVANGNTNIGPFVYMVDSTGYTGNGAGGDELTTTVAPGDTVVWQSVSVDPSQTVTMTGFTGSAIGTNGGSEIINPVQYPQYNPAGSVWGGYITGTTNGSADQYSISLLLNGSVHGWFDPFLISNAP